MSFGILHRSSHLPITPGHGSSSQGAGYLGRNINQPKLPRLTHDLVWSGSGLRTPPFDDMSTVFHPSLASYDSHGVHSYPAASSQAARAKAAVSESRTSQYYRDAVPSQQPQHQHQYQQMQHNRQVYQQPLHQCEVQPISAIPLHRNGSISSNQPASISRQCVGQSTPPSTFPVSAAPLGNEQDTLEKETESLVYHSLQIPKCISPKGGNLADFAAQMTCLFWFESMDNLKQAELIHTKGPSAHIPRLPSLAKPYDQFRKWVYNVLSTTQVTQNVILLALLFIYRLKMSTPQIKGRAGSEYRLLTVALMLGNKFLDDNTYTNKTWAEVSCFAVQEIHVMEVEFLSNMRYNLVATSSQWEEWLNKLACFHEYYERAVRLPASPIHNPSPNSKRFHSPMPSPTSMMHPNGVANLPLTPVITTDLSPSSSRTQNWSAYQSNAVSPLATKPNMQYPMVNRKRSPDEDAIDHPAKRPAPQRVHVPMTAPMVSSRTNSLVESARLPVPHLTVVTEQPQSAHTSFANTSVGGYPHGVPQITSTPSGHVSLPPLQPGVRAMTTVFQPTPPVMVQQQPTLPSTTGVTMTPAGFATHAPVNFNTPNKHAGPGTLAPFNSSPLAEAYGQVSAVHTPMAHTPISNSPSVYLQQRPSPYKPVRHVNTLLYPPPSASLDQYHLAEPLPPNQMHYHTLGRRNDLRTGIVPEFIVYNRGQPQHQPLMTHGLPHGHYPS